jgi:acyl-coenzyme A thioesterase PaaI-like protein
MSFNRALGLRCEGADVVLDTQPEHEVVPGTIHFAVLTTMAEVAAAAAADASGVPASLTVSLLERASPGRLVAKGRVVRKGKRLIVAEGEVFSGETLVAKAVVTFAVVG